jgi:hypothetical protein
MTNRPARKPSDFEFEVALPFHDANDLLKALDAALSAMANYGSDDEHMATLSMLRVVALKHQANALNLLSKDRQS